MVNIYKNEEFLFSKSIFENRFWTFINVHFPVYLQSLEKPILLFGKKTPYGVVWSKYQFFNYEFVTVIFPSKYSLEMRFFRRFYSSSMYRGRMDDNFTPKNDNYFNCVNCDFKCSKKCDWDRHILTLKHQKDYNGLHPAPHTIQTFGCEQCGNSYKYRQGLWKHAKVCKQNINQSDDKDKSVDANLIFQLIKQNDDFKNLIIDQTKIIMEQNKTIVDAIKQNNNTVISNNNINSNNKTFNLNLFLHEDCKDAMNMSDFLESIKIQLADVEAVGELGYVNGISKLIISNLKALDMHKRPVHCTDEKRETIYIKEAGVWTKDEDNNKLRRLIKTVSNRNFKHTRLYKEKYPDCIRSESKYSDIYNKIVLEATGGGSKCNDYESENKIMKKIAKEITIDKQRT
jgi:hypothetical protein